MIQVLIQVKLQVSNLFIACIKQLYSEIFFKISALISFQILIITIGYHHMTYLELIH